MWKLALLRNYCLNFLAVIMPLGLCFKKEEFRDTADFVGEIWDSLEKYPVEGGGGGESRWKETGQVDNYWKWTRVQWDHSKLFSLLLYIHKRFKCHFNSYLLERHSELSEKKVWCLREFALKYFTHSVVGHGGNKNGRKWVARETG